MKTMRTAFMFIALAAISAESWAAMSIADVRREARFLTDRMGHELGLSNRQYNDVYEINFDFLYQANEVIDDVVYGYDDAIDYYYYLLDVRNEDLMYVLRSRQYRRFVRRDYFFRPFYMVGHTWGLRIWERYPDRSFYYFGVPACYLTYSGAHYRIHFVHSYYAGIYAHKLYHGAFRLWGGGYAHHHHDGWHCKGTKKHPQPGSRPWSNARNYEQSRKDLAAGYVTVSSRDASKRVVKVDSEASRRTAITSTTRTGSSRPEATGNVADKRSATENRSRSTSSATGTATRRADTGSSATRSTTRNSSSAGTAERSTTSSRSRSTSTATSSSSSAVKSSSSSGSSRSSSTVKSGSSTSGSSRSRSTSTVKSGTSTSGSSVSTSRSSASRSSGSSTSRSSGSSTSRSSGSSSSRSGSR